MRAPQREVLGESSCLFQGGQKGRPYNSAWPKKAEEDQIK
jgi:hypothetical protein